MSVAMARLGPERPLHAVLYTRVSTGAQAESGLGLADQYAKGTQAIEARHWQLVHHAEEAWASGRVRFSGLGHDWLCSRLRLDVVTSAHRHDGRDECEASGRTVEDLVAVAEDAAVGGNQPIALAAW